MNRSTDGNGAFVLCELEWMRERLVARLTRDELALFVEELGSGPAAFDADALRRVVADVEELEEQLVSMAFRLTRVPIRDVQARPEDVAEAAAVALADGIADVDRALHAASWIAPAPGMRALARSLRENDAPLFWNISPAEFIAAFSGMAPQLARDLCREAGVDGVVFSELEDGLVAGLADALDRSARSIG